MEEIEKLKEQIAALKSMDLGRVRARVMLLIERSNLDDMSERMAEEHGVDTEVALLAVNSAWTVHIDRDPVDQLTPDHFAKNVETSARLVINALAEGKTKTGDDLIDAMLTHVVDTGRSGLEIKPTRAAFEQFGGLVAKMRGCSDC